MTIKEISAEYGISKARTIMALRRHELKVAAGNKHHGTEAAIDDAALAAWVAKHGLKHV